MEIKAQKSKSGGTLNYSLIIEGKEYKGTIVSKTVVSDILGEIGYDILKMYVEIEFIPEMIRRQLFPQNFETDCVKKQKANSLLEKGMFPFPLEELYYLCFVGYPWYGFDKTKELLSKGEITVYHFDLLEEIEDKLSDYYKLEIEEDDLNLDVCNIKIIN